MNIYRALRPGGRYLIVENTNEMFADFTGYGQNVVKDPIYERFDPAALRLFELLGSRVRISEAPALWTDTDAGPPARRR